MKTIIKDLIADVKSGAITQAEVLQALHDIDRPANWEPIANEAEAFADDNVQIDGSPMFSETDEGCWVSAWVYVDLSSDDEDTSEDGEA